MVSGVTHRIVVAVSLLGTVPGVALAQPIDPSVASTVSPAVRAIASFVLIAVLGAAIRRRYDGTADRAVDATVARPKIAIVYGLLAFILLAFLGTYAGSVLARAPVGQTEFLTAAVVILSAAFLVLVALGHLVVGTLLTTLTGSLTPFQGLLLGAALSSLGWLFLSLPGALGAWLLVGAFGIGGLTREWVHASRGDVDYRG